MASSKQLSSEIQPGKESTDRPSKDARNRLLDEYLNFVSPIDKLNQQRLLGHIFESSLDTSLKDKGQHISRQYGVKLSYRDGQIEYHLNVNGQDKVLFKTSATDQGLMTADSKLQQLINEKQRQLSNVFHVSFSRDNQRVIYKNDADKTTEVGTRQPRLDELYGIEAALNKSCPSNFVNNQGEGIKFNFLKNPTNDMSNGAFVAYDQYNTNAVYILPPGEPFAATEKDRDVWNKTHSRDDQMEEAGSLQGLLVHELVHNMQTKLGWYDSSYERANQIAQKFGWRPIPNEPGEFMIQDRQGLLYRAYIPSTTLRPHTWYRCDERGKPLDCWGKPTDKEHALKVSGEAMMAQAKVKPVSDYYPNPFEMFAEGVTHFRLGSRTRRDLMAKSPTFYQVIKDEDQAEIDAHFGKGKKIRMPDGSLADDNKANRAVINNFESNHKFS